MRVTKPQLPHNKWLQDHACTGAMLHKIDNTHVVHKKNQIKSNQINCAQIEVKSGCFGLQLIRAKNQYYV